MKHFFATSVKIYFVKMFIFVFYSASCSFVTIIYTVENDVCRIYVLKTKLFTIEKNIPSSDSGFTIFICTQCYGEENIGGLNIGHFGHDCATHEQSSSFVVFPFTCCNLGYFQVKDYLGP